MTEGFRQSSSNNLLDAGLQAMQRGVAATGLDQRLMRAVLDQAAGIEGDDAVGGAHGGEPMRDDQHGAPLGDALHIVLDDALALIVERARRLVEDQDARIADERARDGDALPLAAREQGAA